MRISTSFAFDIGTSAISQQQADLLKVQQQLSTGRRVNSASDDPAAAARAISVNSSISRNDGYKTNQDAARTGLSLIESTLGQFGDALEDVRSLLIQAGNGSYSDRERFNLAADLRSRNDYLMSLANTRDANGAYIFSGYQEGVQAFQQTAAGVVFQGDQGSRELQVADGRSLAVAMSGAQIFERVRSGNGVFLTGASGVNTGSGVIDAGQVVDAAQLDGHAYAITLHVIAPGNLTYDIADTTTGSPVSTGNVFNSGMPITLAGMQVTIAGLPAEGDRFTLEPSPVRSIFNTLRDAIQSLETPAGSPAAKAQLQMGLSRAVSGVDRNLDAAMLARTQVGAGLSELDALAGQADTRGLQYKDELSSLLDTDYTKAISDLSRLQTMSDATQKAFVRMTGKSLFDLL